MNRLAVAAIALCCAAPAFAEQEPDAEGCKDSPLVARFPGMRLNSCEDKDFDQVTLPVGVGSDKALIEKPLEGHVQTYYYSGMPANKSPLQVARNFENALKKGGAKITVPSDTTQYNWQVTAFFEAKKLWVNLEIGGDGYKETLVALKQMEQEVEATSESMMEEIGKSGRVAVYGINFDTGKATITKDSKKVLEQVRKLLTDNDGLKLRIEGHTDNVGKDQENLALSKQRAAAVKAWLVKNGVEPERLTTDGFGSKKPLGDNKTDEGKAKNRRVELVKV